jgi:phage terminase small subunit
MAKKLTAKQAKFIEVYDGNGTQSAKAAGYNGSNAALGKIAYDLLRLPHIDAAIKARESKAIQSAVMNRLDRQIFWSELIKDPKLDVYARLRASELLGKSEADFTERVVNVDGNLADRLARARARLNKGIPDEEK